ncbi:RNA-directed DNA polymerase, eukaryota, reverse transcriptase zinc-binding domain protein [Tanacetum coccineum]
MKNKEKCIKNSRNSNKNLSNNSHDKKDNGDCNSDSGRVGDEVMSDGVGKAKSNDGFVEDLNGVHFPLINGMVVNEGYDSSNNVHGVEVNDDDEEVVKKANVSSQKSRSNDTNNRFKSSRKSLVDIVNSNMVDNKLQHVPIEVSDNGDSIVIFDDEIIELGSQKWNLIVCGQFIGCSIGFNEARYHIRRMWNRFRLKDVIAKNVVQKWSTDMCLDKAEPKKIPVWVKIRNVLMEAWSVKGIIALASSDGKLVIMDEITAKIYVTGIGRIGFARVLVEIDAKKGIKDKIEIMYKSKCITEGTKKIVDVEYSWIPCIYSHCKVFGHTDRFCKNKSNNVIADGFVKTNENNFKAMQNRKYGREGFNMNRRPNMQNGQNDKRRNNRVTNKWKANNRFEYRRRKEEKGKGKGLDDKEEIDEELIPNTEQRKIVDEFMSKNNGDNNVGMNGWNEDMKRYYRDRKELFNAAKEIEENEDVIEEECVKGLVDFKIKTYVFLLMETIDKKSKFFCTMIYASNLGMEGRKLWKDLEIQKIITNGIPWIIMGDFNVTLEVFEHSNGSAYPTSKMSEFQDCINNIEVDDLHSEGFHYTWTKSLKNPKCNTLKKLDKIIVNEAFIDKFQQAHGVFLPYMISDHSPIVVRIPNCVQKRKGSFRFSNFITDKEDFLPTVRSVWNKNFEGHTMYRVVQTMKAFKRKLKQISKCRQVQKLACRQDIFINRLNPEEVLRMVRPVSDSEIKNAMFAIEDSKAPGPDGYTSRFYKSA